MLVRRPGPGPADEQEGPTVLEAVSHFLENLETWILALASSVWIYPALYGFATIDGFFPPIPSESVVITLAVSSSTEGVPILPLVLVIAAVGAWTGDQIAYQIGKAIGTERVAFLRTPRGRHAIAWAERALQHRGASFILAARYIPIGRVAVNMTAGAVGYPRRRFMAYAAIAAVTWALYSTVIGLVAAQWLGHSPLLAMGVGVVAGVLLGVVVDKVVTLLTRRRGVAPGPDGGPVAGAPALGTPTAAADGLPGDAADTGGTGGTSDTSGTGDSADTAAVPADLADPAAPADLSDPAAPAGSSGTDAGDDGPGAADRRRTPLATARPSLD